MHGPDELGRYPARLAATLENARRQPGIQMMCGSGADVSADVAADIPLLRGALRLSWLKALNAVGVTRFIATSKIGYDFVCHTGDLANFPFYHPRAYQSVGTVCYLVGRTKSSK